MVGDLTINQIQTTCIMHESCGDCPYRDGGYYDGGCIFIGKSPSKWDVKFPTMSVEEAINKIKNIKTDSNDMEEALKVAVIAMEEKLERRKNK